MPSIKTITYTTSKHRTLLIVLILVLVSVYLYLPSIKYPFIWDDQAQIVTNNLLRDTTKLPQLLLGSTFDIGGGVLVGTFWRPLVSLSNFINFQLWGLYPPGFRVYQLIFHSLVVFALYMLILRLGSLFSVNYSERIALLTTVLYLVQPVHVESVVYIGSIGEILYTLLSLVALLILARNFQLGDKKISLSFLAVFFLLFFMALLAKESALVLIPITAVLAFLLKVKDRRFWINYTLGTVLSLSMYVYLRIFVAQVPFTKNYDTYISSASLFERIMTVPYILMSYIMKLTVPFRLLIYENTVVHKLTEPAFWLNALGISVIILLTVLVAKKIRSKIFVFFIAWFCIGLIPVLNIYGIDSTIADRWLYFPAIGFYGALCTALVHFLKDTIKNFFFIGLCIIVLLAYSGRTLVREYDWRSGFALYSHDLKYIPDSFELLNNYALELVAQSKVSEARTYLEKAVELRPGWFVAETNLGMVYHRLGLYDLAERQYLKVLKNFLNPITSADLVSLYIDKKDYVQAKNTLTQARTIFPTYKRLVFLEVLLQYKMGNTDYALDLMRTLLKDGAIDQDIKEFLVQGEKVL